MKSLALLLVIAGVCVSSLGASGFHTPSTNTELSREQYSMPLFAVGAVALVGGGVMLRAGRQQIDGQQSEADGKQSYLLELEAIQQIVARLDESRTSLAADVIRDEVGKLLAEEYFDLTQKSDALAQLIGFTHYAQVWDGVAVGERLLARCWSMCTDGFPELGLAELPLARAAIERAVEAMRRIS